MRIRFDNELDTLYMDMVKMSNLAEKALELVYQELSTEDRTKLEEIIETSKEIDQKDREIETLCMRLLLRRQPVAGDLRTISSALKMIDDIERIGDNAADIAEILPFISSSEETRRVGLDKMAKEVSKMVTDAIDAFVRSDALKSSAVIEYDDVVDAIFTSAKDKITDMIKTGDEKASEAPDLLLIAKYLERMGDHAASLATWVLNAIGRPAEDKKQ